MKFYIIIPILCLVYTITSSQVIPAHKAVEIVLSTDKKVYLPFEPVYLTVEFKNTSKTIQYFDWIHIFRAPIRYRLIGKKKEFHIYDAYSHGIYGPSRPISKETEIRPGESIQETFVVSKYFDIRDYHGPLTLEVGYPIYQFIVGEGEVLTDKFKTKKITVEITVEQSSEVEAVKLMSESLPILLSRDAYNKKIPENLAKIINQHPNSYLIDQAYYFMSIYYYQVYEYSQKSEQLENAKRYLSEFLQKFPQSIYREEAKGLEQMINAL